MEFIIEIISEFISGKLVAFVIAVAFIAAGIYMWTGNSAERAMFDAAVGKDGKTYQGEIRFKRVRSESTDGAGKYDEGSVNVNYLTVAYDDENGEYQSIDVQVERDEYDAVKENQKIQIKLNPANPEYIITPMKERPTVIWFRIGGGIFITLGAIFVLMILASFGD